MFVARNLILANKRSSAWLYINAVRDIIKNLILFDEASGSIKNTNSFSFAVVNFVISYSWSALSAMNGNAIFLLICNIAFLNEDPATQDINTIIFAFLF